MHGVAIGACVRWPVGARVSGPVAPARGCRWRLLEGTSRGYVRWPVGARVSGPVGAARGCRWRPREVASRVRRGGQSCPVRWPVVSGEVADRARVGGPVVLGARKGRREAGEGQREGQWCLGERANGALVSGRLARMGGAQTGRRPVPVTKREQPSGRSGSWSWPEQEPTPDESSGSWSWPEQEPTPDESRSPGAGWTVTGHVRKPLGRGQPKPKIPAQDVQKPGTRGRWVPGLRTLSGGV